MMIRRRNPTSQEQYMFMGNGARVQVGFLGVVRLHLGIEFFFNCKMCRSYHLLKEI